MKPIGRYEILEELGQGAMGAVYKARDPMMDRVVAVKTILASALTGPLAADYRERFFREARAAGRLAHPGIVTVYDVAEQEGTPFLVMEFVEGTTLEKLLETGERFDADRVMEFGLHLADALDYAHKNGVVHRDIKPANIMVTSDGRPKITDFGVAKLTASQVTTTGQLLGTPAYMAPEQFTGAPIDGRADIFSLGVLLYWLATGDRPFTGETLMAVSYKIVHTDPVPPRKLNPAIPRDLENVILKCMEKDPAERYQNGDTLARDLRTMREGRQLDTLNRERLARDVEKTAVAGDAPQAAPVLDATQASADTAETVAVLPTKERTAGASSSGMRGEKPAATVPLPPRPRQPTAATPQPISEEKQTSKTKWLAIAAVVVLVVVTAAAVMKQIKRPPAPVQETQASLPAQPPAATGNAATLNPAPTPPPPSSAVTIPGHPDVSQTAKNEIAEAERVTAEVKRKKAEIAGETGKLSAPSKAVQGLQLEIRATGKAGVVVRPDEEAAASYQLRAGNSATVEGKNDIKLLTDNAGALQLNLNGKNLGPLGPDGSAISVRITPNGVETLWSGNAAEMSRRMVRRGAAETAKGAGAGRKAGKGLQAEELAGVNRETKQMLRGVLARLRVEARGIPLTVDLIVKLDGALLFQREAVSAEAAAAARGARGPVNEERMIPPGSHQIEVFVGRAGLRMGTTRSLSGEFTAGQQRVLRIELVHESGGRGERMQNRLNVVLE